MDHIRSSYRGCVISSIKGNIYQTNSSAFYYYECFKNRLHNGNIINNVLFSFAPHYVRYSRKRRSDATVNIIVTSRSSYFILHVLLSCTKLRKNHTVKVLSKTLCCMEVFLTFSVTAISRGIGKICLIENSSYRGVHYQGSTVHV